MNACSSGSRVSFASQSNSIVVFCNPCVRPPKRMNICDQAPVNPNYINTLALNYWAGEMPTLHVPLLLNPYEAACFQQYFRNTALQSSSSVFLVPNRCHMAPFSHWFGSEPSTGSLSHHAHNEVWVAFLFAAQTGSKFWLWIAKRESELLGETGFPNLKAFMEKYGLRQGQQSC